MTSFIEIAGEAVSLNVDHIVSFCVVADSLDDEKFVLRVTTTVERIEIEFPSREDALESFVTLNAICNKEEQEPDTGPTETWEYECKQCSCRS